MNILKKKLTVIADVFPKLRIPKNLVKQIFETSPFRGPFDKQHAKLDQTQLKSEIHYLCHIYGSLWRQFSWKNFLLVICKFLTLFLQKLAADQKYSLLNKDNLRQQFRCNYLRKKDLFWICFPFLKTVLKFEYFQKKDDPHSWCISAIADSEKRG